MNKSRRDLPAILYVDDEHQNLVSFKAAFRRDYNILTANSAHEAIELLKTRDVALIITDQRMPEMTGVQFLEHIIPSYPDTVRMVLTGFSDVEAIISAINTGRVFRYVTKPWDETELRMTIENAFHLYGLQQRNKQLVRDLQQKVEEQEKTLRLFERYVPQEVVQKALSTSEDSIFEGELRDVAVLFCDIRGFTRFSERSSPKEVVACLNHYYRLMSECIKRHDGTVNQFVGDEVFASFGALMPTYNNELKAVLCALEMMERIAELDKTYGAAFGRPFAIGIGINSGEVVAGNLGSEDRIEFSITGDTVNTGKRIETLTKNHHNTILVHESVFDKIKDKVEAHAWEPVNVHGKSDELLVYQIEKLKQ